MKRDFKILALSMVFNLLMITGVNAQYDNLYFDPEVDEMPVKKVVIVDNDTNYDNHMSYSDRITRFHRGNPSSRYAYSNDYYRYNNDYRYANNYYDNYRYGYGADRVIIHVGSPNYNYNRWNRCRSWSGYGYTNWTTAYYNPYWRSSYYGYSPYYNNRYYPRYGRNYPRYRRNDTRVRRNNERRKYIQRNGTHRGSRYGNNRSTNKTKYRNTSRYNNSRSSSSSNSSSNSSSKKSRSSNGRRGRR